MGKIGYNIFETNILTNDIKFAYEELGTSIKDNWKALYQTLDANWVGEDEQSYCVKLAEKTSKLYSEASKVAQNACDVLYELTKSWLAFQQSNLLQGATIDSGSAASADDIIKRTIDQPTANILTYNTRAIGKTEDRGLVDGAEETCKKSLTTFVHNIQSEINNLFGKIKSEKAYFGTQTTKIDSMLGTITYALREVVTAVDDMKVAISKLTTSNYGDSQTEVGTAMTTVQGDVRESINNYENRWSE